MPSGSGLRRPDRAPGASPLSANDRIWQSRAITLVETMMSLFILTMFMLGFISTMLQSRRITESSVLQSAATSTVYGLIEQMKGLDFTTQIPAYDASGAVTGTAGTFYVFLRQDQDSDFTIPVTYTAAPALPKAPTICPPLSLDAAHSGASPGAIDYNTGDITLSTVTGTASQKLKLTVWIWIDEIPDPNKGTSDVKRVTVVYSYTYNDGSTKKTIRDMEVFLRTKYDL